MSATSQRSQDEAIPRPAPVSVQAESAYPELAAGCRVRITEMGSHLDPLRVHVSLRSSLSSAEYLEISTPGLKPSKALALSRSVARAVRHAPPAQLILVHRLRSLIPLPTDGRRLDVYDFDDALHVGGSPAHHNRLAAIKQEARRCVRYMRSARLVLAGNQVLADAASQHSRRVEIVPSCVDPTVQIVREHQPVEVFTLGWIGSHTTTEYLRPLFEVLDSLASRGAAVRLVMMGARPLVTAPWLEYRPWSSEGEGTMLAEIDAGVMPLPDNPWTRGKCGYKLLRYYSAGLPAIASPVGINARLLDNGGGFAATTPAEWSRAITDLASDATARGQIGARARTFVKREYSYQTWAPRLADLLRDLAGA